MTIRQTKIATFWIVLAFVLLVLNYEAPSAFFPLTYWGGIAGTFVQFATGKTLISSQPGSSLL